jgi:hypothetical protein
VGNVGEEECKRKRTTWLCVVLKPSIGTNAATGADHRERVIQSKLLVQNTIPLATDVFVQAEKLDEVKLARF